MTGSIAWSIVLSMIRERATRCSAFFVCVSLAACGGAAPMAASPASTGGAAPSMYSSVDDAERDLARAERDLDAVTASKDAKKGEAPGAPPPPPATSTPPTNVTGGAAQPAQAGPPPAADKEKADEAQAESSASPCDIACRALASMRRAADAVCRLAGDGDPRCADAKKRVDDGVQRASSCKCDAR